MSWNGDSCEWCKWDKHSEIDQRGFALVVDVMGACREYDDEMRMDEETEETIKKHRPEPEQWEVK